MTVFELLKVAWLHSSVNSSKCLMQSKNTAEQARPILGLGLREIIVWWRMSITVTSLEVWCQTRGTALKENCMVLGQ